jgi:hypothetical protein
MMNVLNKSAFLVFDIYVVDFSMSRFVSTMRVSQNSTRETKKAWLIKGTGHFNPLPF